jgi:hypothetical protein
MLLREKKVVSSAPTFGAYWQKNEAYFKSIGVNKHQCKEIWSDCLNSVKNQFKNLKEKKHEKRD